MHWVELSVALLSILALWQLAPIVRPPAPPSQAVQAAPAVDLGKLQFASRLARTTPYAIDAISIGAATMPAAPLRAPVAVAAGSILTLRGWATAGTGAAPAVIGVIDDSIVTTAPVDGDRPDVARFFNEERFAKSGFALSIPTAALLPGRHDVELRIVSPDGSGYYDAPPHVAIIVSAPGAARSQSVGHIDAARVSANSLEVGGWAIDWAHRTLLRSLSLVVDGKPVALVKYGGTRPDVAAHFGDDAYLHSGFDATISIDALRAGKHRVGLRGTDVTGATSDVPGDASFVR